MNTWCHYVHHTYLLFISGGNVCIICVYASAVVESDTVCLTLPRFAILW